MDLFADTQNGTSSTPAWAGYAASGVAVVFFGSNFVPVKKFETGDGMFFQWILCSAIWLVGLCIHSARHFPKFYPLAMLGGFLWSTGNVCVVPIVKTIGLSQGLLIWASLNLAMGWASGRFGWFGLNPEIPGDVTLNYIGVAICMLSAVIYVFIKSETQPSQNDYRGLLNPTHTIAEDGDDDPLLSPGNNVTEMGDQVKFEDDQQVFFERWSLGSKRILGVTLAVFSGLLYGSSFDPVIYVQDRYSPKPSKNGLDYVFAHWCGIYATSSFYFLIYCMVMKNRPRIYPQAILPGFVSGVVWAVADAAWFIANAALSEAVAFPIITTGPGIIVALWGVFVFKEIRGARNLVLLLVAGSMGIAGSVMVGYSKRTGG